MKATQLFAALTVAGLLVTGTRAADPAPATVYNSSDLLGMYVKNPAGEDLGELYDFVVNSKTGKINYAVISYGETLGFGGKMFAVSPSAISVNEKRDAVILDAKEADFKAAEGFDANRWPAGPDARWGKAEKSPEVEKAPTMVRLSSLDNLDVYNEANEKLGDIYGFALDMKAGHIQYIAMQYGGLLGVGSSYFAIPYKAAVIKAPDLKGRNMNFIIAAQKADFENKPGFDTKAWPTTGDTRFKVRDEK